MNDRVKQHLANLNGPQGTCACGGTFWWSRHCGAKVCGSCDTHKGLARCFCGWAASGGDGRRELVEMGENIEED